MTTVLVYGNFRSVHVGHFRLFEFARTLGSRLVVGIHEIENDDYSLSKTIVEAIPCVDQSVSFVELRDLLQEVKPEIVVRGSEHRNIDDEENTLIRLMGIKLFFGAGHQSLSQSDFYFNAANKLLIRDVFKKYVQRCNVQEQTLKEILKEIESSKVKVVGDLIVDQYFNCQPLGMSQEEPSVVFSPVNSKKYLGGAAIVAAHCKALGAQVELVSIIGKDSIGEWATRELNEARIDLRICRDDFRPTVLKQRFKSGNSTLFRLTHVRSEALDSEVEDQVVSDALHRISEFQAIIFSDFSYGCLSERITGEIIQRIKNHPKIFSIADSQTSSQLGSLSKFRGVKAISATEHEARTELRNEMGGLAVVSEKLVLDLGISALILKLGADGLLYREILLDGSIEVPQEVPSVNMHPFDLSGAGDSLLAMTTLALSIGADLKSATTLGSIAAGIQISRQGNIPVTRDEVTKVISDIYHT